MNQNLCYNCGGALLEQGGKLVCPYCGTFEIKNISDEEHTLLYNAYQRLRLADFFDAEQQFDDIIQRHPHIAQGYWGRLLAKYGIKYEDDYNGKKIPSCYAATIESFFEASDYRKALELADADNRAVYEEHANYIERVRKEWVEKASKQKPYDIFISYKDSGENGERTQDSIDMQMLYLRLKEKDYRVFYSRESLRGTGGDKYEPYIYSALSTAKVMILYASKPEYVNATWVKNEWMRYLKRMRDGEKKEGSLLVAYKGFAPRELPSVLSSTQAFDANDWMFLNDLYKKIDECLYSAGGHSDHTCEHVLAVIPGKAPTCTLPGLTETTYCADCGQTIKAGEIIPATGHHFGEWTLTKKATCTENGKYERVCECGERETKAIPSRGGHIPNAAWETVREPAPGKEGLKVRKCAVCGEHVEEVILPALPRLTPSENLAYKVNPDGWSCTVTGSGECTDKEILIPSDIQGFRVTAIGTDIRKGWSVPGFRKDITGVTIPSSVTAIEDSAFKDSKNLLNITIPSSVSRIGKAAFWGCTSLKSIVIPDSVTRIEKDTFWGCENLTDIVIPDSVSAICEWAFAGCKSLASLPLPSALTSIDPYSFQDCEGLTSVSIPNGVTSIGKEAFRGCTNLTEITLSDSVKTIGKMAFLDCVRLKEANVPNAESIDERAFEGCTALSSAVLPESLQSIGGYAFCGCGNLHAIRYKGSREQWSKVRADHNWKNGSVIQRLDLQLPISQGLQYKVGSNGKACTVTGQGSCTHRELMIPETIGSYLVISIESDQPYSSGFDKEIVSVHIPNSVRRIGDRAFAACSSLAEAEIPDSVTEIGTNAFAGCESMSEIKIPPAVAVIPTGAFRNCTVLERVELPDSVTEVGEKAFAYCTGLTSVQLGGAVASIGKSAFSGCTNLSFLKIPDSVKSIGNGALAGIGKTEVSPEHPKFSSVDGNLYTKDKSTFLHCDASKRSGFLALPDFVSVIEESAFAHCDNLMSLSLPDSVTNIGGFAFSGCTNLTAISYAGTKRAWKKVRCDKYWTENSAVREIHCKNGTVKIK